MYQAVRDPRSNLHFNACLSSIITSGTAWLNFTDAYRALAPRRPLPSRTAPPSRLYALVPPRARARDDGDAVPSLATKLFVSRSDPKTRVLSRRRPVDLTYPVQKIATGHARAGTFNYIMYTRAVAQSLSRNMANCIIIDRSISRAPSNFGSDRCVVLVFFFSLLLLLSG